MLKAGILLYSPITYQGRYERVYAITTGENFFLQRLRRIGTVAAANIGSGDHLTYAMVGDTANLNCRIQRLNEKLGPDLLISSTIVDRLAESLAIQKLPATTVKD